MYAPLVARTTSVFYLSTYVRQYYRRHVIASSTNAILSNSVRKYTGVCFNWFLTKILNEKVQWSKICRSRRPNNWMRTIPNPASRKHCAWHYILTWKANLYPIPHNAWTQAFVPFHNRRCTNVTEKEKTPNAVNTRIRYRYMHGKVVWRYADCKNDYGIKFHTGHYLLSC